MIAFINGKFVTEKRAMVSVFDRSFLYGDGLFETMRVTGSRPQHWWQHMERLKHGADFLGIKIPFGCKELEKFSAQLIVRNRMPEALLRLTLSRGVGVRGYSPRGADKPAVVMTLHPAPVLTGRKAQRWKVVTSSFRLPAGEALAQFKTCNKLAQIMARMEADKAGADEALLLNTDGFVVEASSSNLFWIESNTVCTAPLSGGILAGVTRQTVLELCNALGVRSRERNIKPSALKKADGIFLSLSSWGIVGVKSLDGKAISASPLIRRLQHAYAGQIRGSRKGRA